MDDRKLIEYVRQHVELYDVSDERYVDAARKRCIWNEISQHLGYSAITCKRRWSYISGNYQKSLKERATRSGLTGQPRNVRYKYENQLTFLLPFIRKRAPNPWDRLIRESNEMSTATEETLPVMRDDNRDSQTSPVAHFVVTRDETSRLYGEASTPRDEQSGREIPVGNDSGSIGPKLTKSNYPAESNDLGLRVTPSALHPVDAFLAGIAPTLKSLSPYRLNIVKTNIFSIVQEAEIIQIIEQQE